MTVVILGATGDLTRRLLFPAIYHLYAEKEWVPTRIIGYAMEDWTQEKFTSHLEENLRQFVSDFDEKLWNKMKTFVSYQQGDLTPESLKVLVPQVQESAVFYLGLPPQLFPAAGTGLGQAGLNNASEGNWRRLVIEKPFGWDLPSAEALGQALAPWWKENQIFRIDHFLGKGAAQNVLVFRFVNRLVESIWDSAHIAQVQITYAESLGVEGRWRYYDKAGALRDMLQNHLMQLFALMAMEPPIEWDADDLHNHKAEVLRAVRHIGPDEVDSYAVAGQYTSGRVGGKYVPGYHDEEGIPKTSGTETFAALKFYVDNWRWHGVPFYLRSGKRIAADYAEIAVQLKPVPAKLFGEGLADWLVFRMKPDNAIDLVMWVKKPGLEVDTEQVILTAPYNKAGETDYSAYEQLLLDVMKGDQSAFPRFDEVKEAWRIIDPILKAWTQKAPESYDAGSQGPLGQDRLMDGGHAWRQLGQQYPE